MVVYVEDGGDCNGLEVWYMDMVVRVVGDCCVGECEDVIVRVMCDFCKGNCIWGSGGVFGLLFGIIIVVGCRC